MSLRSIKDYYTGLSRNTQEQPGRMAGKAAIKSAEALVGSGVMLEILQVLRTDTPNHKYVLILAGLIAAGFAAHSLYEDFKHRPSGPSQDGL